MTARARLKKLESAVSELQELGVYSLQKTFNYDDPEIAVEDTSAVVDLSDALPAGAIALTTIAELTEAWSDGSTGTFSADVGEKGGDDDLLTPTPLDIDGSLGTTFQNVSLPIGGETLAVTFTGSVDLDTATAGSVTITVLYLMPKGE